MHLPRPTVSQCFWGFSFILCVLGNLVQVDGSVAGGMPGKFRGRSGEGQEGEDEKRYHNDGDRCRYPEGGETSCLHAESFREPAMYLHDNLCIALSL